GIVHRARVHLVILRLGHIGPRLCLLTRRKHLILSHLVPPGSSFYVVASGPGSGKQTGRDKPAKGRIWRDGPRFWQPVAREPVGRRNPLTPTPLSATARGAGGVSSGLP